MDSAQMSLTLFDFVLGESGAAHAKRRHGWLSKRRHGWRKRPNEIKGLDMALLDTAGRHAGIPTLAEEAALIPQQERVFARWIKDKKLDRAVSDLHPDDVIRLARSAFFAGVRTYGQ